MAKNNDTGLFQWGDNNQFWGYRITIVKDGKRKDTTSKLSESGEPYKTKAQAKKARELRLAELRATKPTATFTDCKVSEMWTYYLKNTSNGKATGTVKKYTSLWKNHISVEFGDKYFSEINVSDLEVFLQELYNNDYSYKYVESFLKLFYQLWGLAYKTEHIDPIRYTRMFVDSGTKLKMPKIRQEDAVEYNIIKNYNSYEISQISEIFKQGNCYTAFLLGYYLGIRIGECFGLMWQDYNWGTHKIKINKQMIVENGVFCLRPVKTLTAVREIDVPDILHNHLKDLIRKQTKHPTEAYLLRKSEIVIDKTKRDYKQVIGGDFINRKENGELLTVNSIKFWAKKIKAETGITFKYHSLRKTHLSMLAAANVPAKEVMQRAGHKKLDTTMKYYINSTSTSKEFLLSTLNGITTDEMEIEVLDNEGNKQMIKESTYIRRQSVSAVIPH